MRATITATPTSRGHDPWRESRSRRRRGRRRALVALAAIAALLAVVSLISFEGLREHQHRHQRPESPATLARQAAAGFLARYVRADGRVVRRGQGGDTVSEGESYGLLLSVAIAKPRIFAAIWRWERVHLQERDGLFAWHWRHGRVVGTSPASDADLVTAWALVLAGARFHDPGYLAAGRAVAHAVLAHETAQVAGRLELAAGPWATSRPTVIDPSYLAPEAMVALAAATHDPAWSELEVDSRLLIAALEASSPDRLPPDWARLDAAGVVRAIGAPSTHQAPSYGLDAQRIAVWYGASCSSADRALAAALWPSLRRARGRGGAIAYSLTGRRLSRSANPLGYVAAAAAAGAAGARQQALRLLAKAGHQDRSYHTYYGDAWLAIGRVLLDTNWLTGCRPLSA